MLNFCTLFDSNYLPYGINLYNSLKENCRNFRLYVLTFDEKAFNTLQELKFNNLIPIKLSDFEDEELLKIKPTRTRAEYCWTTTPSLILYCIKNYNLENCTYLDSDIYFYGDPSVLINEVKDKSVLITEHRFSDKYVEALINGRFCVQFMFFKNNESGLKVLNWWRERCNEWCFNRIEGDKFGDQKYLDKWPELFANDVHILEHLGGGVAPWNVQQYNFIKDNDGSLKLIEIKSGRKFDVIFYHYHGLKLLNNNKVILCEYDLSKDILRTLYLDYIKLLTELNIRFNNGKTFIRNLNIKQKIKHLTEYIFKNKLNNYQIYNLKKILLDGTFTKS